MTDLIGGRTQSTIDGLVTLYPLIQEGKLRPLAIARGERWPALPDVPTLVESGYPDFTHDAWDGVAAPAGTPPAIIDTLNAAINTALKTTGRASEPCQVFCHRQNRTLRPRLSEAPSPIRRRDGARS